MAHIDTIVTYVADELGALAPGRDRDALIADARTAVAAVRRFDLDHKYRPLNERAFTQANDMKRKWQGFEEVNGN